MRDSINEKKTKKKKQKETKQKLWGYYITTLRISVAYLFFSR